jgi:GH24 family phage-related lysozyme (muramidase)
MSELIRKAAEYIAKHEGFAKKAYFDVNAYRIGYGSDTITKADGKIIKVEKGDTVTREEAQRDLERRIGKEFLPKVEKKIGSSFFAALPDSAKIALVSIAYNYGNITKNAIVEAARTGDVQKIASAILSSTKNDNQRLSEKMRIALYNRRKDEVNFMLKNAATKLTENKNLIFPALGIGIVLMYLIFKR